MTRLCDGSTVVVWPRAAGVVHAGWPTVWLDRAHGERLLDWSLGARDAESAEPGDRGILEQLGRHVVDGPAGDEDTTLRGRLAALDQRFGGWVPGLYDGHAATIAAVESLQARRRVWPVVAGARPALPVAVVRRWLVLQRLGAQRIYVDNDVDGLSLLLARDAEVVVYVRELLLRRWLQHEAQRLGVAQRVQWHAEPVTEPQCELGVIAAGSPADTYAALQRAVAAVRAGGHIAARFVVPWLVTDQLRDAGLQPVDLWCDFEHTMLPGGFVIDDAGDLVLAQRPADLELPRAPDAASVMASRPAAVLDLDSLAPDRLDAGPAARFLDALAARAAEPEATRSLQSEAERDVMTWFGSGGTGLTAELRTGDAHLLLTLMPYDSELEYAALCGAYAELADGRTRLRPQHANRWRTEMEAS